MAATKPRNNKLKRQTHIEDSDRLKKAPTIPLPQATDHRQNVLTAIKIAREKNPLSNPIIAPQLTQ